MYKSENIQYKYANGNCGCTGWSVADLFDT